MKPNREPCLRARLGVAIVLALSLGSAAGAHAQEGGDGDRSAPTFLACRPVAVAAVHRATPVCAGGDQFLANQRLALIDDDAVPCVHADTGAATTCAFRTRPPATGSGGAAAATASTSPFSADSTSRRTHRGDDDEDGDEDSDGEHRDADACGDGHACAGCSGDWLKAADGRRYALVGQAIGRDGGRGGEYVIGAAVTWDVPSVTTGVAFSSRVAGTVPCIGASGRDTAGTMASTTLSSSCVLETLIAETNGSRQPVLNFATLPVCTSSHPHPDGAQLVSADPQASVYCYRWTGAGLNDINGTERDEKGVYYVEAIRCHTVVSGGIGVPAAKRPATRSLPAPGRPRDNTPLLWRVVNPNVTIAN